MSVICPGIVDTDITRTTTFSGTSADEQEARRRKAAGMYARRNYPPEKVAEQTVVAVLHNRAMVPVTAEAKLAPHDRPHRPRPPARRRTARHRLIS